MVSFSQEYANPFNWVGSKFRYLEDFMEVLPSEEGIRVLDCFLGGGDLISKLPESWNIKGIDIMPQLVGMHKAIQGGNLNTKSILEDFNSRGMSKTNSTAYLELRDEYNNNPTPELLYLLMTNAFNNQLRFNQKGGFNMPFGKDRSSFNPKMQAKLTNYSNWLKTANVTLECKSYKEEDFSNYDLLLLDPPYLNTTATYNEQGGWTNADDVDLLEKLTDYSGKFIYFNQLVSKGVENTNLKKWIESYNVKVLSDTTENCNHQRKGGTTVEIMVTNY